MVVYVLDRIEFLRNVVGGTFLRVKCYVPILFPIFKSPQMDCIIDYSYRIIDWSYCPIDLMLDWTNFRTQVIEVCKIKIHVTGDPLLCIVALQSSRLLCLRTILQPTFTVFCLIGFKLSIHCRVQPWTPNFIEVQFLEEVLVRNFIECLDNS